jgi:DNA-binding NarL/FixJ family response regulator
MKQSHQLIVLTIVLFGILLAIDQLKNDEQFVLSRFLLDVLEKAILVLAVVATAYVALETRSLRNDRDELIRDLARVKTESDGWRNTARVHIDGLSRAIDEQFRSWRLSESEAEIALFMLKGLTFKEIANLRGSGETTVRQQATSIYRKSGLASRAELGAFFLEDLLSPHQPTKEPSRRFEIVQHAEHKVD